MDVAIILLILISVALLVAEIGIDPQGKATTYLHITGDVITGLGGRAEGVPRETRFEITAASEVMAMLCLAADAEDLRRRIDRVVEGQYPFMKIAEFLPMLTPEMLADGMLFTQSRIGMNDAYVGLGIVAAYALFAVLWPWIKLLLQRHKASGRLITSQEIWPTLSVPIRL